MYSAAESGLRLRVRELVKQGVDVEQTNYEGETPLYAAASNGHLAVVQYVTEQNRTVGFCSLYHVFYSIFVVFLHSRFFFCFLLCGGSCPENFQLTLPRLRT